MKRSLLLLVVFFSFSCSQDSPTDPVDPNLPTVTTSAVNSITSAGAIGGGSVTADAGSPVTVRGLCIKTSPGASISDRVIISGAGVGDFNVAIDALTSNSTYFIKAFATNSAGTAYGAEISFSTLQGANASTVLVGAMDSLYSLRADNGALKWKKKLTGNVLSTTYAKGKIFVVTEDKKLHCYDTTGNFSWQKSYAADIKELPVVIGNDVYLLTDNIFFVVDAITGNTKWQRTTDLSNTKFSVHDNVVYLSERLAGLKALAATTGTLLWSNQTTIDYAYPKIDGDKLVTFSTSTNLTAYNKNNGNVYWNVPDIGGGDPAPLINTGQGNLFYYKTVNGSALIAHDLQTGDFKWSKPVSAAVFNLRTPVIDNDNVLITSLTHVAVFKAATGAPVSIIEGELSINGDVSAVNNVAFLACKSSGFPNYIKGHVTAYNISNGTRLWRSTERNDFMTTPCIITSNDKMYRGGHLY